MRRWLLVTLLGSMGLPCVAPAQEYKQPFDLKTPAVIAEGQTLFNRRCAGRCHGVDGSEGELGSTLAGKPYLTPPYDLAILLGGRPGTAMPSWAGRLSDDELWKIIAFLSSLADRAEAGAQK
ncbi:MAG TPA: c-type cytochrome [Methylomirabilota bacterium]|nr:c-type cytochrome [Methylomirabilota bacterium]